VLHRLLLVRGVPGRGLLRQLDQLRDDGQLYQGPEVSGEAEPLDPDTQAALSEAGYQGGSLEGERVSPFNAAKQKKLTERAAARLEELKRRQDAGEDVNIRASVDDGPLLGMPRKIEVPGRGVVEFGPIYAARNAAARYAEKSGIKGKTIRTYAKADPERGARIAKAFEEMKHDPTDPAVKRSYDAMVKETIGQWEAIKETGLKVEFIKPGQKDPYAASPRLAHLDVLENNHLWVYPTDSGFGSDGNFDPAGNPLLQPTDVVIDGKRLLANDVFRIVNDYGYGEGA
jgi:hypothetical protein